MGGEIRVRNIVSETGRTGSEAAERTAKCCIAAAEATNGLTLQSGGPVMLC